jgi:5-methylcytosine-specific restriction endonuclease McrA
MRISGVRFSQGAPNTVGVAKGTIPWNKGIKTGKKSCHNIPLQEIFDGKHPNIKTASIKQKLLDEGYKSWICESCKNTEWLGEPIPLELEHKDGNSENHARENLELLCPNCHSLTPTYKGRNRGNGRHSRRTRYKEGKSF